ncbi:hypothetical protein C8R47DRAFT_290569 [Mycena vitilis]|nr:hypothetical protein C8R47DRAFT_290569 [Mycena vitilis]
MDAPQWGETYKSKESLPMNPIFTFLTFAFFLFNMFNQLLIFAVIAAHVIAVPLRRDDPSVAPCPATNRDNTRLAQNFGNSTTGLCFYGDDARPCSYQQLTGTLIDQGPQGPTGCPFAVRSTTVLDRCPFVNNVGAPLSDHQVAGNTTSCNYPKPPSDCVYENDILRGGPSDSCPNILAPLLPPPSTSSTARSETSSAASSTGIPTSSISTTVTSSTSTAPSSSSISVLSTSTGTLLSSTIIVPPSSSTVS